MASTVGHPTNSVTCLLYGFWAGTRFVDAIRWCRTWLPKSVAGGLSENRIQERARTLLVAMEGEEEGVAMAAIDSSKFFDMIVLEVVFPMMGNMAPRECVEAPNERCLPFEAITRNRVVRRGKLSMVSSRGAASVLSR